MMWWTARDGLLLPGVTVPDGSFAALGMGGHFVVVLPAADVVVVHRMASETDQATWRTSRRQLGTVLAAVLRAHPRLGRAA
jgi:CubicO group peptidase (beta-lactamase class C family)